MERQIQFKDIELQKQPIIQHPWVEITKGKKSKTNEEKKSYWIVKYINMDYKGKLLFFFFSLYNSEYFVCLFLDDLFKNHKLRTTFENLPQNPDIIKPIFSRNHLLLSNDGFSVAIKKLKNRLLLKEISDQLINDKKFLLLLCKKFVEFARILLFKKLYVNFINEDNICIDSTKNKIRIYPLQIQIESIQKLYQYVNGEKITEKQYVESIIKMLKNNSHINTDFDSIINLDSLEILINNLLLSKDVIAHDIACKIQNFRQQVNSNNKFQPTNQKQDEEQFIINGDEQGHADITFSCREIIGFKMSSIYKQLNMKYEIPEDMFNQERYWKTEYDKLKTNDQPLSLNSKVNLRKTKDNQVRFEMIDQKLFFELFMHISILQHLEEEKDLSENMMSLRYNLNQSINSMSLIRSSSLEEKRKILYFTLFIIKILLEKNKMMDPETKMSFLRVAIVFNIIIAKRRECQHDLEVYSKYYNEEGSFRNDLSIIGQFTIKNQILKYVYCIDEHASKGKIFDKENYQIVKYDLTKNKPFFYNIIVQKSTIDYMIQYVNKLIIPKNFNFQDIS